MKRDETALLVILFMTVILVLYFGFESSVTVYVVFVSIILTLYVVLTSSGLMKMRLVSLKKKEDAKKHLTLREREIVTCFILSLLENSKSAEIDALASETGLEKSELLMILTVLETDGVLSLVYPPMQTNPIVVGRDIAKEHELIKRFKASLTGKRDMDDSEFRKWVQVEVVGLKASRGNSG